MQSILALTSGDRARLAKELKDGIDGHLQAALDMKHRLNSLAPTCILPPELLAEVFIYLAHSSPPTDRNFSCLGLPAMRTATFPYAWLKVTHVCHHWREVALRAPQLWSTIWITGRTECLKEMISRSKQAPLAIKADKVHGLRWEGLEIVMRELPRIVSFDARMPPRLAQSGYTSDAPKLRELVLQTADLHDVLSLGTLQLQDHFATCDLPSLERLELYSYQIPWRSKLLKTTLKHLTLHSLQAHSYGLNDIEEIMQILGTLPLLESLSLRSCLPTPPVNHPPTDIVELPNLRSLRLHATVTACRTFLQRVSIPSNTSMIIDAHNDGRAELNVLVETIREWAERTSHDDDGDARFPVLRSIDVRYSNYSRTLQMRAWPTFHDLHEMLMRPKTLPEPFIDITLRYPSTVSPFTLFRAVPTASLESLLLLGESGVGRSDKAEWQGVFEQLPELRELGLGELGKDHLHQILDYRIPCEQEPSTVNGKRPRRKKQYCLPHLEVLKVANFEGDTDAFLARLKKSLIARKKASLGLKTLIIRCCGRLVQEDVDGLKKYVGKLDFTERDWDEYEDDDDGVEHFLEGYDEPIGMFGNLPFHLGGMWDDGLMDSEDEDEEGGMFLW
ncbi:hypothetical protein BC629DRAFT_1598851 [Irpex lacteus]|nr:hypothetical protein BC629DRAFT_1598851 [Irpex lacteus]